MNIEEYIESGILEAYVLGAVTDAETRELLQLKAQYPQLHYALTELELDMENIAGEMAIAPPPGTWLKIEESINDLIAIPEVAPQKYREYNGNGHYNTPPDNKDRYIEVESSTDYMRIHKQWKWVFAGVFILAKIFLACAIYFYLENRQSQQQVQELKSELGHYQVKP